MVNTIEISLAQKMQEALTAYGLKPNEAAAEIMLITSATDAYKGKLHKPKEAIVPQPDHSDSLFIEFSSRRVHDSERAEVVKNTLKTFVLDFIEATGLDKSKFTHSNGTIGHTNAAGGYGFRVEDVTYESMRQGCDRPVDDVWYGLEKMIKEKATFAQKYA